jgi:hypothetical protein
VHKSDNVPEQVDAVAELWEENRTVFLAVNIM